MLTNVKLGEYSEVTYESDSKRLFTVRVYTEGCDRVNVDCHVNDGSQESTSELETVAGVLASMASNLSYDSLCTEAMEVSVEEAVAGVCGCLRRTACVAVAQLLMSVNSKNGACDTLSNAFETSITAKELGSLIDWRYHKVGTMYMYPTLTTIAPYGEYTKGSFVDGQYDGSDGRTAYTATVGLCMKCSEAWSYDIVCDKLEDLIWNIPSVYDWSYLKVGGQHIQPQLRVVAASCEYAEGDAFK